LQASHRLDVGRGCESQDLQRDNTLERNLLGLVHDSHAAAADFVDNSEFAALCGDSRIRGRSRHAMNNLDPGPELLDLRREFGMIGQELRAIGLPAGL